MLSPLINEKGKVASTDTLNVGVLSEFSASVFTSSQASHISHDPEHLGRAKGCKISPTLREEQVHDHLMRLNVQKSMEPGNMHHRILKKLFDVVTKPLSIVLKKPWSSSEVSGD